MNDFLNKLWVCIQKVFSGSFRQPAPAKVLPFPPQAPVPQPAPPAPAPSESVLSGVDISHWEDVSDWRALAKAVSFVYSKATQGLSFSDPKLGQFALGALSVKLPFGAYHVIECGKDPVEQVAFYLRQLKSRGGDQLRPALDFETEVNQSYSAAHNKAQCLAFMKELQKQTNRKPILYCNESDLRGFAFSVDEAALFDVWIAAPKATIPGPIGNIKKYLIWQHSFKSQTPGIGSCDSDYLYGTIADIS